MTLALATGPFRGLKQAGRGSEGPGGGAGRCSLGPHAARSQPGGAAGRRGGGGRSPATGASQGPRGQLPALGLALGRACEFLRLCTTRGSSGWARRSLPIAPRAHSRSSGSRGPRLRGLPRNPVRPPTCGLQPRSLGSISYPKPGVGGWVPAPSAPHLRPRAPLRKPPALPEAAAIGARPRAPPHSSSESGAQWSRWLTCREATARSRPIRNVHELPSLAKPQT